ncbi:rubrerythrin [Clostridium saccharobutylicum]|nr:zinc-ribbon domain-containing protein [Clostridium saccharobutylicum]NOW20903.1 rubrerythrin [Clostridium saccharobutylicum]
MSKMIKCKTCGADIASSAKTCPSCGAKNKKAIL